MIWNYKYTFAGIGHFYTDFTQIFTIILAFDTDSKDVFKVDKFVSVSRLQLKMKITHILTIFEPIQLKFFLRPSWAWETMW